MKNYFTKKSAWKTLSVFVSFFLLMEVLGSVFPAQGVFAQTPPTTAPTQPTKVDESTLTAATGWTKGTSSYDALSATTIDTWTNSNGDKANCEVSYQFQGLSQCTVTYPNGTQSQTTTVTAAPGMNGTTDTSIGADNHITAQTQTPTPPASGKGCSISPSDWGNCVAVAVAAVALMMAGLVGALLGIVGALFNWIVVITIFRFGDYFGNSAGLLTAWGILRDVGNIMLLFGFIFMGVVMILDLHTIDTRKAIPQLIIVALLLNFSLFAAEAVIDVSNVLSASLYNQAGITGCSAGGTAATCANTGISAQVLSATGLSNIFSDLNGGIAGALGAIGTDPPHQMFVWIGITIFMTIVMVVLLAASIMLVIRAVVLVFVMVLAPLGFAAMVIPSLSGLGKQWRDALISQAFFAPVYLLLLLVSLKIMTAVKAALLANAPGTLLQALTDGNTSLGSIILVFVLISGFMIAALMTAKKMGAIGADFATSVATKTVRGTVLAPVKAVGAPIYRNTVSKGAAGLASLQTKSGLVGWGARTLNVATSGGLQTALGKVQESKFLGTQSYKERKELVKHIKHDEHTAGYKDAIKKGIDAAPGTKERDAMEKAFQEMADADTVELLNSLKPADAAKAGTAMSTAKFKKIIGSDKIDSHTKSDLVKGRYAAQRAAVATGDVVAAKAALKDMSEKEWEIIAANDTELLNDALSLEDPTTGGVSIKESILDKMVDSEAYNGSQQEKARLARKTDKIKKIYENRATIPVDSARIKTLVTHTPGKKFAELSNTNILEKENAPGIDVEKLNAVMVKPESLSPSERDAFLQNIEDYYYGPAPKTVEEYKIYDDMRDHLRDNKNAKRFWRRGLR